MELGITPLEVRYVCTLLHRSAEFRKLHYFAVPQWAGKVENHEAVSLRWGPLTAPHDSTLRSTGLRWPSISGFTVVYRGEGDNGVETVLPNHAVHRTGGARCSLSGR